MKPGMMVLPATSIVRAPAGGLSEPLRPTETMRLSVTRTSPLWMTSSAFIVMIRARAIGRELDLVRTRRIVARSAAGNSQNASAVVAVDRDRLQSAARREEHALGILAREVRTAAALRGGNERRRAAARGNRSQFQRVRRIDAADLGRRSRIVGLRRRVQEDRIELIG